MDGAPGHERGRTPEDARSAAPQHSSDKRSSDRRQGRCRAVVHEKMQSGGRHGGKQVMRQGGEGGSVTRVLVCVRDRNRKGWGILTACEHVVIMIACAWF